MSMVDPTLASLSAASFSLLSELLKSPSPFPPPPPVSLSTQLRQIRAFNKHLRLALEHTHNLTTARRGASAEEGKGKAREGEDALALAEEDEIKARIDGLRKEVEEQRGAHLINSRVKASLDQALLVVGHMLADDDEDQQLIAAQLAKRDGLALKLLDISNQSTELHAKRSEAARETRLVTRESAGMAQELREATSDKKALADMTDAQRKRYAALKASTTSHLSRLTIIHQVLALLVAEAGIEWYFPELLDQLEDEFVGDEEDQDGVSDRRLMRLMCKSVEELVGDVESDRQSGVARAGTKRRADE